MRTNPMADIERIVIRSPRRTAGERPAGRVGGPSAIPGENPVPAPRPAVWRVAQRPGESRPASPAERPNGTALARANRYSWRGVAMPYLVELYRLAGSVVSLGVLVDGQVHYVEQLYDHRAPKTPSRSRRIAPAHCTAIGKLLLAHGWSGPRGPVPVNSLPALTAHTIGNPRVLRLELAGIRRTGLAFSRQEYVQGLACIAAPVRGRDGQVVAGLAVGDDVSRLNAELTVRHLRRAALALSTALARAGFGQATDLGS